MIGRGVWAFAGIRYGDPAHRDIAGLRRLLQEYVDHVMAFAKGVRQ